MNRVRKARDDQRVRHENAAKHHADVAERRDATSGKLLNKLPVPTEELDGYISKMSGKLLEALFWEP